MTRNEQEYHLPIMSARECAEMYLGTAPDRNIDYLAHLFEEYGKQFKTDKGKKSILDTIPEGYSQLMMILRNGLSGDTEKVRRYAEKFIELHPENRLSKGFRNILDGKESTVCLDNTETI